MTKGKMILGGCAVAALAFAALVVAAVLGVSYLSKDPKDVAISIEAPTTVNLGEDFVMTVVVENQREDRAFGLTDIDLAEEYLESFLLIETTPAHKSSMHVPVDNTRSFAFDRPVPPGETHRFAFRLRPTAVGLFRGDVDVCEGMRFLTALMQTEVRAAE